MIGNSLLTQVGIAGLAIGIIITYIKPTFVEIRNRQDEITQTKEELQRVTEVNQKLSQLYSQVNEISQVNRVSLATYIPDKLDEVKVLKDISIVAKLADVLVTGLKYKENAAPVNNTTVPEEGETISPLTVHTFELAFTSSYEDFKKLLALFESNNYPLDISNVSVKPNKTGQITVDLQILTYSIK